MRAFFRNTDSHMPEERYAHGRRLYSSQRAPPATFPGCLRRIGASAFPSTEKSLKSCTDELFYLL